MEKKKRKVKLARRNPGGMGDELLIKLDGYVCLFAVDARSDRRLMAWVSDEGVDLYWRGRRVESVFARGSSKDCWWPAPVPAAVKSLLKRGVASKVDEEPELEPELPM